MLTGFGVDRVIEPKGTVPVTAWKINNDMKISSHEMRLELDIIHIETDNFQQLCSESSYDETLITNRIIDIVNKRGKLHNPFTDSGGICYGKINEIGRNFSGRENYSLGENILCITTLTALPIYIEEIHSIDYNYGNMRVKGYAILFEASPTFKIPEGLGLDYTMSTLDEAGSISTISEIVEPGMRGLIIGKDLISSIIYSGSMKKTTGGNLHITVVLDSESCAGLTEEQVRHALRSYTDEVHVVDITCPIETYEKIKKSSEWKPVDITVACEDLTGVEVFAVLATKEKGSLFFTSLKNNYSKAILVAESMGKEITTYSLDQYLHNYDKYTLTLLGEMKADLEYVGKIYEMQSNKEGYGAKKVQSHSRRQGEKIDDFVFSSPVTKAVVEETLNVADYDCNVIIQGETGVGKEKILALIHNNSARKSNPCIKINCATIQENLAESEFFGYEEGAFTGASAGGKKGYFELANNGILFLDEVGQLSISMQSKLLRVLQENQFYRIGGVKQLSVNVRVICANNVPLRRLVDEGKFREDLYYRLNICTIEMPPLRYRREDIQCLAETFLEHYNKKYHMMKQLSAEGISMLMEYDWPGNVRELENAIHRSIINSEEKIIRGSDIEGVLNSQLYDRVVMDLKSAMKNEEGLNFGQIIENQEKKLIQYALVKKGSTRKAAEFLSMTQAQLMRKKQKYDL